MFEEIYLLRRFALIGVSIWCCVQGIWGRCSDLNDENSLLGVLSRLFLETILLDWISFVILHLFIYLNN